MDHWRGGFDGRPLTRAVYVAVRWANIMELWIAYRSCQERLRLCFLRSINVSLELLGREQRIRPLQLRTQQRLGPLDDVPPPPRQPHGQGVWV